jgi:hypothetical protein
MSEYRFSVDGLTFRVGYSGVDADAVILTYSHNGESFNVLRNFYTDKLFNKQQTVIEFIQELCKAVNALVKKTIEKFKGDEPSFNEWRDELKYRIENDLVFIDGELKVKG